MGPSLPLLRGEISLEEALLSDRDVISELAYPAKRLEFFFDLCISPTEISELVGRHLGLKTTDFEVSRDVKEWLYGSFNVCLPIRVLSHAVRPGMPQRALIRFALPYKVGESHFPGNVEEKVRCEAAMYIWTHTNCPEIPIPKLYGFGVPGKQSFTTLAHETTWGKIKWYCRWVWSCLSPYALTPAPYVPHLRQSLPDIGYLVIEHVEGKMLSESWEEHHEDANRRKNLYRDLARIMLRLANIPQPRIGSWSIDNNGVLTLTNRPLTLMLHQLENVQIPTGISRDMTYTSVEPYLLDLLSCHDQSIRYQPNSIHDQADGEDQLAALTAMRAVMPNIIDRRLRSGPFALSLTDIHQSNIFVDDEWNIKYLIDLEWACARPIEMLGPPGWLSNCRLERLAFHLDDFSKLYHEFLTYLEKEELSISASHHLTQTLRVGWAKGAFWYFHALDSTSMMHHLFINHIQPLFSVASKSNRKTLAGLLMPFWNRDAAMFISSKVIQHDLYLEHVKDMFAEATNDDEAQ